MRALRALAVPHERALPADEPRVPVASDNNDDVADDPMARMRSFPISHRLVAALLDEGKGAASAARALRSAPAPEPAWLPSALPALRSFNLIFEARVKAELLDAGVLLPEDDDSLAECMRLVRARNCAHSCVRQSSQSMLIQNFIAMRVGAMASSQFNRCQRGVQRVRFPSRSFLL